MAAEPVTWGNWSRGKKKNKNKAYIRQSYVFAFEAIGFACSAFGDARQSWTFFILVVYCLLLFPVVQLYLLK